MDILDANDPIPELNTIFQRNYGTYAYSDESRASPPLSDIPDSVRDGKNHKKIINLLKIS